MSTMQTGYPVPDFSPTPADPCFCRSGRPFGACCGSTAPHRALPGGVQVFTGFLDPVTCYKWVKRLERQPRKRATITDVNRTTEAVEDPGRVCFDVKPGPLRKVINDKVQEAYLLGERITGRVLEWFETPRVLRYEPGGFYHRHADSCQVVRAANAWFKVRDRDLSLLLYLNEDFTGGGLSFVNFNYHYRPRIGDLLVFPSDNRYEHRAEKVLSGVRYAIVSWAAFVGTPRVLAGPPGDAIRIPPEARAR